MKINVAKSSGFCFGVKRALKIAYEVAKSKATIEMLGDIVHNENVVREITKAGVKKVKKLRQGGKNKILLIRAHGAPRKTFKKARQLGYKIVDATCPMVCEIHKIAITMEKKGYAIIIIGDKKHDEVCGIIGQLRNKAIVIDDIKDLVLPQVKTIKKAAVVVQSTQNLEKVLQIIGVLKQRINQLKFFNTICNPTKAKQREIKSMPRKFDLMIIIGSKTSANTRRLYEISKALNKRSYWIQSKKEMEPRWFKGVKTVGISAGASTPDYTTQDVVEGIRRLNN